MQPFLATLTLSPSMSLQIVILFLQFWFGSLNSQLTKFYKYCTKPISREGERERENFISGIPSVSCLCVLPTDFRSIQCGKTENETAVNKQTNEANEEKKNKNTIENCDYEYCRHVVRG